MNVPEMLSRAVVPAVAAAMLLAGCASAPAEAPEVAAPIVPPPPETGVPLQQPRPPYWSIEVAGPADAKTAARTLARVRDVPYARAEKRRSGRIVRVGAWPERAGAEALLPTLREQFGPHVRVLQIENPVDWVLPDGATARAYRAPKAAPRR